MVKTVLKVKSGRDWSVRRGHPWLFSGALSNPPRGIERGCLVDLVDDNNQFLARGYFNPQTDIAVRVLTRNPEEEIDQGFLVKRIDQAFQLRRLLLDFSRTNVFRLVNAEGDFLPGAIVDSYAGHLVVQSHTAGMDQLLEPLIQVLIKEIKPAGILIRNDVQVRVREGLSKEEPRVAYGSIPDSLVVQENGLSFFVNLWTGQKTGFFTDQRDKRQILGEYAPGLSLLPPEGNQPRLLNCFSFTAGFSIYALKSNPELKTINVDESAPGLEVGLRNFELNDLNPFNHEFVTREAFKYLQEEVERGSLFEGVILDPPAFAKTHREKERALKGYIRLNSLGLSLVRPGGLLVTCSCSGSVNLEEFENCVREAAARKQREVQILNTFVNAPDHPFTLAAIESRYLKVLFCRVF